MKIKPIRAKIRAQGAAAKPQTIDEYIASCPANVRPILRKIRAAVRKAAPGAIETISYRMPALRTAEGVLIYFAAFQRHIGIYPPVRGSLALLKALAPYRGEKGNLRFPLDRPIPYGLIATIVKSRLKRGRSR
jgi:uncharacterized protein YdhG (YjbR/CyaY superfamily)